MKLWSKNESGIDDLSARVEKFTVGNDTQFDLLLAAYDVQGNLAQAEMLESVGLLNQNELQAVKTVLKEILNDIETGKFAIAEGIEDIHSQIEFLVTQKAGEAGKKIHTGRSRNDQVLLDIKLFLRAELQNIAALTEELFNRWQQLSEEHSDKLLPGYTHLQIAMPSSFGLWFGAYAEALCDDMELLVAAWYVCNKNPLGSAASYGSSFPVNREMTTEILEFNTLNYNSVYAQMTRGKTEKIVAMALANLASTLSRFAYDITLYLSQNFGFISFPESLTTGSSIMPHKKNPDVFELIRARCNRIQALPNELTMLMNNLPSGYHRDMQLTKESLFPAIVSIKDCLEMTDFMLQHIMVNDKILDDEKYRYLFSVEEVNKLVKSGIPFRDAYKTVGKQIEAGNFNPERSVSHTHAGSIGNLCNKEIRDNFRKIREQIS
jgi:argininosuccinate lyase